METLCFPDILCETACPSRSRCCHRNSSDCGSVLPMLREWLHHSCGAVPRFRWFFRRPFLGVHLCRPAISNVLGSPRLVLRRLRRIGPVEVRWWRTRDPQDLLRRTVLYCKRDEMPGTWINIC